MLHLPQSVGLSSVRCHLRRCEKPILRSYFEGLYVQASLLRLALALYSGAVLATLLAGHGYFGFYASLQEYA